VARADDQVHERRAEQHAYVDSRAAAERGEAAVQERVDGQRVRVWLRTGDGAGDLARDTYLSTGRQRWRRAWEDHRERVAAAERDPTRRSPSEQADQAAERG